jgi:hypothetical protein
MVRVWKTRSCGVVVTMFAFQASLLARTASRCPGTPLEQKMDAFGRPNSWGEREIVFKFFPKYINISETKYLQFSLFIMHLTFWSIWWCTWLNENVIVK